MSTRRLGVAVAVLGGFLYAIGGSDGHCPLNTGDLDIIFYNKKFFNPKIVETNCCYCVLNFSFVVVLGPFLGTLITIVELMFYQELKIV